MNNNENTPTDGEREALSEFLFTVYDHGTNPNALREADAILAFLARFRRSEVPEPSGYRATLIREAREHADHYRRFDDTESLVSTLVEMSNALASTPEPQSEPSDAQVRAALDAFRPWLDPTMDAHREIDRKHMRAALRAALGVR